MRIIKESEIKELVKSKNLAIRAHVFAKENDIAIKTVFNTNMYILLFPFVSYKNRNRIRNIDKYDYYLIDVDTRKFIYVNAKASKFYYASKILENSRDYYVTIENLGTFHLGKFKTIKEAREKAFEKFPESFNPS